MNHLSTPSLFALALTAGLFTPAIVCAHSPFTPEAGKARLTPSFSYQSFDEFSAGDTDVTLPDDIIRQQFRLFAEYGLGARSALDLSLGYARTEFDAANIGQDVLADTYLGYRYRFADEDRDGVAASFRLGATLPGDYDVGNLDAPGDDAFGVDLSVSLSRHLANVFRGNLMAAYYFSEGAVPDMWLVKYETVATLGGGFYLDASTRAFGATSGLDIGGPGFTGLRDLPKVRERGIVSEAGVAYGDGGGRYFRAYVSQLFNGRNVGEELTFGGSATFSF